MSFRKHSLVLFFSILILLPCRLEAQDHQSKSKKAVKAFTEALSLVRQDRDEEAVPFLEKAIKADDGFVDAYQLLAQIRYQQGDLEQAIKLYACSLKQDPDGNPEARLLLAGLYLQGGHYAAALEATEAYLSQDPGDILRPMTAEQIRDNCLFALEALEDPYPFEAVNLGSKVNSELNEYWPSVSVDGQSLMFTVMLPLDTTGQRDSYQEDLYICSLEEEAWGQRNPLGPPVNTLDNEGAQSMNADGSLIWYTACNRPGGQGRCDLYYSILVDGKWSDPLNPGAPLNTAYSEKHPSISADGRQLYFASNRAGGKGGFDIWVSHWDGSNWSKPENLGDSINTPGPELSPFIHAGGQSLYFSSTGWTGMGQADMFMSRRPPGASWGRAYNLGYPLNTHYDEFGLSVNAAGNRAYFASDREDGMGTDIYSFELAPAYRPVQVSYMQGRVYDVRSMKGLEASMELVDLASGEVVMEADTRAGEGDYFLSLPAERDYLLSVTAPGYLFHSGHFAFSGQYSRLEPFRRDVALQRIEAGSRVVLHNIFFASASAELKEESLEELDRVRAFLKSNPGVEVEIGGHTDAVGSEAYNLELSQRRASVVVAYLVAKGIDSNRMKAKGYGKRAPVADNENAEGRALNRRTELYITGI